MFSVRVKASKQQPAECDVQQALYDMASCVVCKFDVQRVVRSVRCSVECIGDDALPAAHLCQDASPVDAVHCSKAVLLTKLAVLEQRLAAAMDVRGGEVMGRGRRGDEWPFVCFVLFCLFSDERQEEERRTRTRTRTRTRSSSSNSRKRLAAHARTHTHTRTHTHIYARFPRDVLTNLDHGLAIIECPVHSNVVNICIQDGCHL